MCTLRAWDPTAERPSTRDAPQARVGGPLGARMGVPARFPASGPLTPHLTPQAGQSPRNQLITGLLGFLTPVLLLMTPLIPT